MRPLFKKIVIYSLVGILQLGLVAGLAEASPRHDRQHQRIEQNDRHHQQQRIHEQRERERRYRDEMQRHEREMRRRDHESEREWRWRQQQENERHDNVLRDIGPILLLFLLLGNQ